jgi:hypothetical protein
MRHRIRTLRAAGAASALFLALSGAAALAQAPATPGPGMGGHGPGGMGHEMQGMDHDMKGMGPAGGMSMGGGMMKHMLCGPTEHIDGKLAYLKAELKLTEQQQAAWSSFADAFRATMQKTAKTCAAMGEGGEHEHHGVLGHLTMMERHMTDHLELVRGLESAIEPLYATLNDDQKRIADHTLMHVVGLGMGEMGGGMGGMGGMSH